MARICFSYKRDVFPDETLAKEIERYLREHGHEVFIDQSMVMGIQWAERVSAALRRSDFMVCLFSAHSVASESVKEEIEIAHIAKQHAGHPTILPVRVAYREPFQYPLDVYLNHLNWACWEGPEDTPRILREILRAISGEGALPNSEARLNEVIRPVERSSDALTVPLPAAAFFETPGSMHPKSPFYIARLVDGSALNAIQKQGETITIKGARQMGKSSLLMRIIDAARKAGKQVAYLDFQQLDKETLEKPDLFFRRFCSWITDELELEDEVDKYWSKAVSNTQLCGQYMRRYLLPKVSKQLVLAMDEVERIFDASFSNDFFGMIRSWHNSRSTPTLPIWRKLDLVLVTSTEPYMFIQNMNQSPFNVGEILELNDFTQDDVIKLNELHGRPLTFDEVEALFHRVGGHPYLVRRALYLVAAKMISAKDLLANAEDDRGPFGDHLRGFLLRLHEDRDLINALAEVLQHKTCDLRMFFRLRGAGLVYQKEEEVERGRKRAVMLPRCELYARYFKERLRG